MSTPHSLWRVSDRRLGDSSDCDDSINVLKAQTAAVAYASNDTRTDLIYSKRTHESGPTQQSCKEEQEF